MDLTGSGSQHRSMRITLWLTLAESFRRFLLWSLFYPLQKKKRASKTPDRLTQWSFTIISHDRASSESEKWGENGFSLHNMDSCPLPAPLCTAVDWLNWWIPVSPHSCLLPEVFTGLLWEFFHTTEKLWDFYCYSFHVWNSSHLDNTT